MTNFSGWIRQELMKKQATQYKAKAETREKYQAYCNPCDKSFLNTDPDLIKGIPCDVCGNCLLYTSPSPRDRTRSRMPSSA